VEIKFCILSYLATAKCSSDYADEDVFSTSVPYVCMRERKWIGKGRRADRGGRLLYSTSVIILSLKT
jgi:hypothetical protein